MRLPLIPSDDKILRTKAKKVRRPGSLKELATNMVDTMVAEGGVGLAAPQIGQSVRLFITSVEGDALAFINPKIVSKSKEEIWWEEGCLSLPRLMGEVKRPKEVVIEAQNFDGQTRRVSADGLLARVVQHEIDHLDGILFPDRMDDLSKLRRLSQEEWDSRFDKESLSQKIE